MAVLAAVVSNSKTIQILETLSKTAHQSHKHQYVCKLYINKYNTLNTEFTLHNCNLTNVYLAAAYRWFQYTKYIKRTQR
jgi:hypothetical protein